ncbi:MAG: hypothetical protein PVF58_15220 [Candidatus Methanofastidiosia archaeon]|jgi:hypothetical protein
MIDEENFEFPDLTKMPLSMKVLCLLAFLFAVLSPDMEPIDMFIFLIGTFVFWIPFFLVDVKAETNKKLKKQ